MSSKISNGSSEAVFGEVDAGVGLVATLPLPVVVEVQEAGLLKAVEVPVAAIGDVRSQFLQAPHDPWVGCGT